MGKINKTKTCINLSLLIVFFTMYSFSFIYANYDPYWIDETQPFRLGFNLTGTSSDIDNYTMNLNIDETFMGANYNFSMYRDSIKMYYYNGTNKSLIPHFLSNYDDVTKTANLQFKAPLISSSNPNQYYIYFGNLNYNNSENYCNTYIHCDFFNRTTIGSSYQTADHDTVAGTNFYLNNEELVIVAGGADTWTGSDQFGSVFLENIQGDVDVIVSVINQGNVNAWNKAGIMIRNDMTLPGSSTGYVFNVVTNSNGYSFQRDTNNNGYLESSSTSGSRVLPSYLRLTKLGQTFTGFYSTTNLNTWTSITSSTITSANSIQDIGLSVTSHAGSTLDTVRFDDLIVKRHITDTISSSSTYSEFLPNELNIDIISPNILAIENVAQNNIFNLSVNVTCFSHTTSGCSQVEIYLQNNFINVLNSSNTPLWINNNQPQICILDATESCIVNFNVNMTGAIASLYDLQVFAQSNISSISNITSDNLTVRIIDGQFIGFNQSVLNFNPFLQFSGQKNKNISVVSYYGDNTNINISCSSGDCLKITPSTSLIPALNEGNSQNIQFTCSDDDYGFYSAIYSVISDESFIYDYIQINCEVEKLYGPISINKITPLTQITNVAQNQSLKMRYNVSCLGDCGQIQGSMKYYYGDWWNLTWNDRKLINLSNSVYTPINYQVLIHLNNSNLNDYNWSNQCNDFRFIKNNVELSYWIENCDSISEEAYVWIKTNQEIIANNYYDFDIYYNNEFASTNSDAQSTFRQNEIHLVNGLWQNQAPVSSDHITSNTIANLFRSTIGINNFNIQGQSYVNLVNHNSNIHGGDDYYYSRYRFLFIPAITTTYSFGTSSDDGSEVVILDYDGYGTGIRTPVIISNANQDVVATWYGAHGAGTCGTSGTQSSRILNSNQGYWFDYVMNEWGGGQMSQMCINSGSGYQIVSIANFANQLYAREYVTPEPYVVSIQSKGDSIISTTQTDKPLSTNNLQPQTCILGSNSYCILEWDINATGDVNTSWTYYLEVKSNYSQIDTLNSINHTINISDTIIPEIILHFPQNNSKIIDNLSTQFLFFVDDNDPFLNCSIYINNIYNQSFNCTSSINNTFILNLSPNTYNYKIRAIDSDLNLVESATYNFLKIYDYNSKISKKITNLNTNLYSIELSVQNKLNFTKNIIPIDFVDAKFNYGSFSLIYDWFYNFIDIFSGDILGWELELNSSNDIQINYSITNNNNSYHLLDEFKIGLE